MPKTLRQPFRDQTNTVNMDNAKAGKRNTAKIATRSQNVAKKTKAMESHPKKALKTTAKSSPNKAKASNSNKISKSENNSPKGKTRVSNRLSHKISQDNATEQRPKTMKKPIEESESKTSPHRGQTLTKNDSKSETRLSTRLSHKMSKDNVAGQGGKTIRKPIEGSKAKPDTSSSENVAKSGDIKLKRKSKISQKNPKSKISVKKIKTTQTSTKPINSNDKPKVKKRISKINVTEKSSENEESPQIIPQTSTKSINANNRPKIKKRISKINVTEKSSENEESPQIILQESTKSINANNRPKVKKGISKVNITEKSSQDKESRQKLKVILTKHIPDNTEQKITVGSNFQQNHSNKEQKHHKSVPSNLKKHNPIVNSEKTNVIPTKVTIDSNSQENDKRYGLRKERKVNFNYCNESSDSISEKSQTNAGNPVCKKTHSVPIYKNPIPDLQKNRPQTEDLYEFTDLTPPEAKNLKKKKRDNSSIIFDKDTHAIMQKLEKKEARAKKRVQTKKKPYEKLIGDIVSNVMQKITKQQQKNLLITKLDNTDSDFVENAVVEFINSNVPSTGRNQTLELPSTNTVSVKKPEPKITVLSNEIVKKCVTNPEIAQPVSSTSTATGGLQNFAGRKPLPELTSVSNKLPSTSATVREITQISPTTNTFNNPVPKTRIATLRKDLPATSTPNRTSENPLTDADISSCFGFDVDDPLDETLGSPLEFHAKNPNANSTMVGVQFNPRPTRAEGPRLSYFNCKDNGLPSGNQRIFIDHTIAESFERTSSKTPTREEAPAKKPAVQQSILDYVEHDEHLTINQNKTLEVSLFNIEELQSPKRKKQTRIENVNVAKRNIQFPTPVSSVKRKPLGDISNSPDETIFYRSDGKTSKNDISDENASENAKPFRFNPNLLKVYTKKKGDNQCQKEAEVDDKANEEATVAEPTSISIMENSDENVADVELFEDPEKVLEDMASDINLKKSRKKRKLNSDEDCERKKKAKKAELDPEANIWIEQFNEMCQQIEKHKLDVE